MQFNILYILEWCDGVDSKSSLCECDDGESCVFWCVGRTTVHQGKDGRRSQSVIIFGYDRNECVGGCIFFDRKRYFETQQTRVCRGCICVSDGDYRKLHCVFCSRRRFTLSRIDVFTDLWLYQPPIDVTTAFGQYVRHDGKFRQSFQMDHVLRERTKNCHTGSGCTHADSGPVRCRRYCWPIMVRYTKLLQFRLVVDYFLHRSGDHPRRVWFF